MKQDKNIINNKKMTGRAGNMGKRSTIYSRKFLFSLLIMLGFVFGFIFSLSLIKAELGCCFDSSSGFCSKNVLDTDCEDAGGEFFSSTTCSVSKCDIGCCVISTNAKMTTDRECELLSRAAGVEKNFQLGVDEKSCSDIANSDDLGACLYGGDYEKDCKYTTRASCASGDFHANILCSAPELKTTCIRTGYTICYKGNDQYESVYYLDNCGNPDALKSKCDYSAGNICAKSGKDYICKDLSCVDSDFGNEKWKN